MHWSPFEALDRNGIFKGQFPADVAQTVAVSVVFLTPFLIASSSTNESFIFSLSALSSERLILSYSPSINVLSRTKISKTTALKPTNKSATTFAIAWEFRKWKYEIKPITRQTSAARAKGLVAAARIISGTFLKILP